MEHCFLRRGVGCRCWYPRGVERSLVNRIPFVESENKAKTVHVPDSWDKRHRNKLVVRAQREERPERDQEGVSRPHKSDTQQTQPKKGSRPRLSPEEERRVRRNIAIERAIKTLTISPGLTGTLALLSGYLLHLDPFGGLHWDAHDAQVGLVCILPLLLLDAALMLPDFHAPERGLSGLKASNHAAPPALSKEERPREEERPGGPPTPGEQAGEASFSGGSAAAALTAAMALSNRNPRTPLMRLKGALMYVQGLLLQRSIKSDAVPVPVEMLLLVTSKFGVMMLQFAILLQGLAKWETDGLYESGLGETLQILGRGVSLQQTGQWAALMFMSAGTLGLATSAFIMQEEVMVKKGQALRKELNGKTRKSMEFSLFRQGLKESSVRDPDMSPSQVADQLKKSLEASKELSSLMETLVEKRKKDRSTQDLWNAVFVTGREVLGLWGVGASYILTGNLLAPLTASVAAGALRACYGRVQLPKMRRRRAALLSKIKESIAQKEKMKAAAENGESSASQDK